MHERSAAGKVQGTWNDSSRERKFHGTNGPGNECSRERTAQGTNVPRNEWSRERKFHHGNECSRERIVLGTNIPDTFSTPAFSTYSVPHSRIINTWQNNSCCHTVWPRRIVCMQRGWMGEGVGRLGDVLSDSAAANGRHATAGNTPIA